MPEAKNRTVSISPPDEDKTYALLPVFGNWLRFAVTASGCVSQHTCPNTCTRCFDPATSWTTTPTSWWASRSSSTPLATTDQEHKTAATASENLCLPVYASKKIASSSSFVSLPQPASTSGPNLPVICSKLNYDNYVLLQPANTPRHLVLLLRVCAFCDSRSLAWTGLDPPKVI